MIGAFLMTIFRKERECRWEYLQVFFRSRDKPTNSINGDGYRFLFGENLSMSALPCKLLQCMPACVFYQNLLQTFPFIFINTKMQEAN